MYWLGDTGDDVAGLLRRLVEHSALTEGQVAFRALVSGSNLRRYCRGDAIPSSFEPLMEIGLACGASEWDLEELSRRWHAQAHPPVERTYRGIRFRGTNDAVGWLFPGEDQCSRVLKHAWEELGRPKPVDPGPGTSRALDDLLLDALRDDGGLRASGRRQLLGEQGSKAFHGWFSDPLMFRRRVEAIVPVGMEPSPPSSRKHLLGLGLLHPDDAMAACAAELVRQGWDAAARGGDGASRPTAPAAERAVEELAEEWVAQWAEWGGACGPSDRELVEDGIRRCYALSGVPWHGRVIWAASPFTGALATRLLPRLLGGDTAQPLWKLQESSRDRENVGAREPDDLRYRMELELRQLAGDELLDRIETLVQGRVAARVALDPSFFWELDPGSHPHIGPADPERVRGALAKMGEQLPRWAHRRLHRLPATGELLGPWPRPEGYTHLDGQVLAPWLSTATLVRRILGRRAAGSLWARLEAYRDANAAGPWWPSGGMVVVAERPQVVRTELLDSPAGPSRRLHAEDAPAVEWDDGTASHVVHGVRLPFDLVRPGWSIDRILAERNTEVRRIAIERLGWDRFIAGAGLALVDGPVPDPGNPGNSLSLYDLPAAYGDDARLLLCSNASPDRDGTVRRFGLHVPASIDDALAAAAWTFDLDRRTYQGLDRAT
jgi:hypothetical protein